MTLPIRRRRKPTDSRIKQPSTTGVVAGFGIIGTNVTNLTGGDTAQVINSTTTDLVGALGFPSSKHPGGVIAVFCDGHTQMVRDNMAPHVYAQLITSDSQYDNKSGRLQELHNTPCNSRFWYSTALASTS